MLRLGIIGAGHFAKAHVAALKEMREDIRVAAVARRNLDEPFAEAEGLGARMMPADELIAWGDIDAVTVCVPNHLHRRYAEAALRAGKHVFCEKPLAMTLEDIAAALEAAKESGRVLLVGHVTRFLPVYMAVAEIVASGRLGGVRTVFASRMHASEGRWWRMNPDIGGGVVFDLLIHDFDLMLWLMGTPASVVARGHKHAQGAYDQMAAVFTYADGRTALVEGGLYLRPPCGVRSMLRVVCERGHLEAALPGNAAPIHLFEEGCEPQQFSLQLADQRVRALIEEYREFMAVIDSGTEGRLRLGDARLAVACAVSAVQSADSRQEVPLPS